MNMQNYILNLIVLLVEIILFITIQKIIFRKYDRYTKSSNNTNVAFATYYLLVLVSLVICLQPLLTNQSAYIKIILQLPYEDLWSNLLQYFSFYLLISYGSLLIFHFFSGFMYNILIVDSNAIQESDNSNVGYFLIRGFFIVFLSILSNPLITELYNLYLPKITNGFIH